MDEGDEWRTSDVSRSQMAVKIDNEMAVLARALNV